MKNDLTPQQKKRAVTEFAAIEQRLDTVLFARDEDDEDKFPFAKTAGVVGVGAGGGLGVNAIVKRGRDINTRGFVLPGSGVSNPSPGSFTANLKTGTKAVAADAKAGLAEATENLSSMFKRLFGKGARAAAKVV
jgi:hypothetical protein